MKIPFLKRKNKKGKGTAGLSIIEILVASGIVVLGAAAFLPVFSFVNQSNIQNKERLAASSLASSVVEEIRAMNYDDIGTVGGNPSGLVPQQQTRTIDGIQYTIETSIDWVGAKGQNNQVNETAYKRIMVTVKAPDVFSGSVQKFDEIHSIAAFEGEAQIYEAGGIRVIIRNSSNDPYLVQPFLIDIKSQTLNPQYSSYGYTIEGEKYFGIIPEGKYTVKVQIPEGMVAGHNETVVNGWVVRENVEVKNWQTTEVLVYMEKEENLCDLYLNMQNSRTNEIIMEGGKLTLIWNMNNVNVTVFDKKEFSANDLVDISIPDGNGGNILHENCLPKEFFGKLWPMGKYIIKIEGMPLYKGFDTSAGDIIKTINGENWSCVFSDKGQKMYASAIMKQQFLFYKNDIIMLPDNNAQPVDITPTNIVARSPYDNDAENAFDNDDSTYWETVRNEESGYDDKIESVTIDAGEKITLGCVRIKLKADYKFHFTLYGGNNISATNKIIPQQNIEPLDGVYDVNLFLTSNKEYRYYKIEIKLTQENPQNVVDIYQIDFFTKDQMPEYNESRVELNGPIDLTPYSPAPNFIISWSAIVPNKTTYKVFTGITSSKDSEPSIWNEATNGQSIPGIFKNDILTGKYLWIKEVFSTTDRTVTPIREWINIEIKD